MKKKIIFTLISALAFASCEKTVIQEPQSFISPSQALGTISGLQNVLTSAYDRFQDFGWYGNAYTLLGDVQSDNIYTNTSIPAGGNRYLGNNNNTANSTYGFWGTAYLAINDLNLVLTNVDKVAASDAVKNQLRGEAYGLRGLAYFDLARAYSWEPTIAKARNWELGVIIRLSPSTDVTTAGPVARSSVEQTYQQIESDLKQAVTLCGPGSSAGTRVKMNKAAAAALLGRTYLYWGKYPEAVTQFNIALDPANSNAVLVGAGAYNTIFTGSALYAAGPESFFEIAFNNTTEITGVVGGNSTLYSYTHPTGKGGLTTFGAQNVSDELYAALIAANDDRKNELFTYGASSTTNVPGTNPIYNWSDKYAGNVGGTGSYVDNIKVIRYADVLLMKAEALAAQNQFAAAALLVVQLHTARNSTAAVPTDISLVDYIQNERRIELYFEGQRFFDLKRRGLGISKPSKTGVGLIAPDDYRLIAPLPAAEINNSYGVVVQNPKY